MNIKQIIKNKKEQIISIKAWVISNRGNNKIRFITINDGSTFENLQIVVKESAKEMDSIRIGASIEIKGEFKLTPDGKQKQEVIASKVTLLKNTDEDYPLQKNGMSREFLREIPHLRHRTNLLRAVMRVRSTLAQEIHAFFSKENFLLATSPIITGNDGEGAGESFVVDDESKDYFFGTKATLGVTGQLHAEAYANGFGNVYTFAPTFRAENSHTSRHAAEFWMVEPEMAFKDYKDGVKLADNLITEVIKNTMEKLKPEFEFLNEFVEKGLKEKLTSVIDKDIKIIDYRDAISKLQEVKDRFINKNLKFGIDLDTEHERYLAEVLYKGPVAVVNYPKDIKAFYMKLNHDEVTVAAFDVLVPGIGELVGGSQRETDVDKLEKRITQMNIDKKELQWYLDLRRFGDYMSTGFGLGFERLVMYVTGIENIRDVIPFPRTPKNMKM